MVRSLRRESPVPVEVIEPVPCGVVMVEVIPAPITCRPASSVEVEEGGCEASRAESLSATEDLSSSVRSSLRDSRERRSRPIRDLERISFRRRDSSFSADIRWSNDDEGEAGRRAVSEEISSRERELGTPTPRRRRGSEDKDSLREDAAPAGGSLIPRADRAEEDEGERP